jgi:hypothetical protein
LAEGTTVNGFTIVRLLGRGDFATAYLVNQTQVDNENAVLKISESGERKYRDRLAIEAEALARFNHPGVPKLLAQGEYEGRPFVVMTLAPGVDLRTRLESNVRTNEHFSDVTTLTVIGNLLEILAYLHSNQHTHSFGYGWVHRDVKDANVIISPSASRITLIDFGFCKEAGSTEKRTDDSFFRIGAPRYSPPRKHEFPTHAIAVQDVFAAGVLAYQMLTNRFPWSASESEGEGELTEAMRTDHPPSVDHLNNTVRPGVAQFISRLLDIRDEYRITASEAALEARNLLQQLMESAVSHGVGPVNLIKYAKEWRDPLYGDIRLTDYEMGAIDTREMQRLRRMKQLGFASFVYGGADHSRLSHSVGCVHRVEQILGTMEAIGGIRIDPETRLVARLYALIHDVTHIPYGHTIEDEFALFLPHDVNTNRINRLVLSQGSELGRHLEKNEIGRHVRQHFDPSSTVLQHGVIKELVTGSVGADLLDYIDRDAYYCGLDHRVDSALFRQFRLSARSDSADSRVVSLLHATYGLRTDREYAVEATMLERYALFLKVYTHRAKAKASALLGKAMSLAMTTGESPLITEEELEQMGDDELVSILITRRRKRVNEIAARLQSRRLPTAVYRAHLLQEGERDDRNYRARVDELEQEGSPLKLFPTAARLEVEKQLAILARGIDQDDVFVYVPRTAPGYKKTHGHWVVDDSSGTPRQARSDWFNRLRERHVGLWELWVFIGGDTDEAARTRLANAAEERFGLPNVIGSPGRQGRLW